VGIILHLFHRIILRCAHLMPFCYFRVSYHYHYAWTLYTFTINPERTSYHWSIRI